jgi:hypothetical protein
MWYKCEQIIIKRTVKHLIVVIILHLSISLKEGYIVLKNDILLQYIT